MKAHIWTSLHYDKHAKGGAKRYSQRQILQKKKGKRKNPHTFWANCPMAPGRSEDGHFPVSRLLNSNFITFEERLFRLIEIS